MNPLIFPGGHVEAYDATTFAVTFYGPNPFTTPGRSPAWGRLFARGDDETIVHVPCDQIVHALPRLLNPAS
jgi:hypothetical protein